MSIGSYKRILFVDYENAGKVDLSAIPADVFVPFFFGAWQTSVERRDSSSRLAAGIWISADAAYAVSAESV